MAKIGVLPSTFHRSGHSAVDGRTLVTASRQQGRDTDVVVVFDWNAAISPNSYTWVVYFSSSCYSLHLN
jgi:hypothetical protein